MCAFTAVYLDDVDEYNDDDDDDDDAGADGNRELPISSHRRR